MNAIVNYFNEALAELHQVRWPTRNQAIRLATIVLIFCAVASIIFGALDFLLSEVVSILLSFTA